MWLRKLKIYRAMSDKEFEFLKTRGFNSTFGRKNCKFFTKDIEYLTIVCNELNYGNCPDIKYCKIVKYLINFRDGMPNDYVREFKERGYRTVSISSRALPFIKQVKWIPICKKELPKLRPFLVWKSKKGRIVRVFSRCKAEKILKTMGRGKSRLIYAGGCLNETRTA